MSAARSSLWWVLGGLLLIAGLVLVVAMRLEPATASVLTYEPLPEQQLPAMSSSLGLAFDGGAPRPTWWQVAGVGLAGLGLLVVVARAAYLAGLRRGLRSA